VCLGLFFLQDVKNKMSNKATGIVLITISVLVLVAITTVKILDNRLSKTPSTLIDGVYLPVTQTVFTTTPVPSLSFKTPVVITSTPLPVYWPDRIVIDSIGLDAPVIPATDYMTEYPDQPFTELLPPDYYAAGYLPSSVSLGLPGNTILIGHHNNHEKVFGHLVDLKVGDRITLYSGKTAFEYVVDLRMILLERDQPLKVREQNARWILPSSDIRITLVTCWPYFDSSHRLIIVAIPAGLAQ
jgi:LPXTG-site transpeptidase (sortase) family protein